MQHPHPAQWALGRADSVQSQQLSLVALRESDEFLRWWEIVGAGRTTLAALIKKAGWGWFRNIRSAMQWKFWKKKKDFGKNLFRPKVCWFSSYLEKLAYTLKWNDEIKKKTIFMVVFGEKLQKTCIVPYRAQERIRSGFEPRSVQG